MPWGVAAAAVVGAYSDNKSSKDAAKAQKEAAATSAGQLNEATEKAREDLNVLFPQARQDVLGGFQGALDVFNQALPQQSSLFQQGNIGAQQALLAGLPQIQNALLGGAIDYSGFQPTVMQQPDFSFANQNIMPAPQPDPANVLSPFSQGAASNAQSLGVNPYFSGGGTGQAYQANMLAGNQQTIPRQTSIDRIMGYPISGMASLYNRG